MGGVAAGAAIEGDLVDATSRRAFLRSAGLLAALGGTGIAAAVGTASPAAAATGVGPAAPAASAPVDFAGPSADLHLLRRATFGLTKPSLRQIRRMGRDAWLDQQLDPGSIDDSFCDDLIAQRFPGVNWTISQAVGNLEAFSWDLMFDLGVATIARAIWSRRQLFEVMVEFWSNHLNVTNPSDSVWATRQDYDRTVIRAHALGRFSDMLAASAQHPAMMTYLNNAESSKYQPNENYGRELLELHSVGVDGGYDEEDMRNSTLVMTGFGIDWNTYAFKYRSTWHHTGPVSVMGWSSANASATGGQAVGMDYVSYLARHPSTARHLAHKLAMRFVSDDPPGPLVDALAQTYLANGTAIVPVLRQLFASAEFAASRGQKVRRPAESVIATARTLGIKPDASGTDGMLGLYWMLEGLGQAPMAWRQPNGYPDFADAWRSAGNTIALWNTTMSLAAHWWPDQLVLPPLRNLLPATLPSTYGGYADALAKRLLGRKMEVAHRDAVLAFVEHRAGDTLRSTDAAVKWRLPYVVSLILDSPYHQVR